MKFQDDISFRNIIVANFQGPKLRKRAITKKISIEVFFFIFHQIFRFIIPCQLTQVLSF